MSAPPSIPKLYHIVHVDRLASIVSDDGLLCDRLIVQRQNAGPMIGMPNIKQRRLQTFLSSLPNLRVGDCVPFYFCPRSIMLYLIHRANHADLTYRGGQQPIVHLEFDMTASIAWAAANAKRWAFTLSNAGSTYFEDRASVQQLPEINWSAVRSDKWNDPAVKEGKQAEFLLEDRVPWSLVERIGVYDDTIANRVAAALPQGGHRPTVQVLKNWYY